MLSASFRTRCWRPLQARHAISMRSPVTPTAAAAAAVPRHLPPTSPSLRRPYTTSPFVRYTTAVEPPVTPTLATTTSPVPASDLITLNDGLIAQYADRKARPVSLKEMMAMGSSPKYLLTAAQWLHAELPVRLAKRLRSMEEELPFGLTKSVEVQRLMSLYRASLTEALSIKCPMNRAEELHFTELIKHILTRHQQVVIDLAAGINTGFLRNRTQGALSTMDRPSNQLFLLQEYLDRFNSARIGLRMLMSQHVALHEQKEGFVGVIEMNCNPSRIVSQAITDASSACKTAYGYSVTPKVEIRDVSEKHGGIKGFHYVSAHLRFMVFELLKNAMRATVEHARRKKAIASGWKPESGTVQPKVEVTEKDLPPIQIVIVDTPTDVTIKISDRGGGIRRSEMPLLFNYIYSAAAKSQQAQQLQKAQQQHQQFVAQAQAQAASSTTTTGPDGKPQQPPFDTVTAASSPASDRPIDPSSPQGSAADFQPVLNTQLHDFVESFGLPIARLAARFLDGDIQLHTMPGYGMDALVFLSREPRSEDAVGLGDFSPASPLPPVDLTRYGIESNPGPFSDGRWSHTSAAICSSSR
jgi:pyruvate dehydrogenase kinase 2/3/4